MASLRCDPRTHTRHSARKGKGFKFCHLATLLVPSSVVLIVASRGFPSSSRDAPSSRRRRRCRRMWKPRRWRRCNSSSDSEGPPFESVVKASHDFFVVGLKPGQGLAGPAARLLGHEMCLVSSYTGPGEKTVPRLREFFRQG